MIPQLQTDCSAFLVCLSIIIALYCVQAQLRQCARALTSSTPFLARSFAHALAHAHDQYCTLLRTSTRASSAAPACPCTHIHAFSCEVVRTLMVNIALAHALPHAQAQLRKRARALTSRPFLTRHAHLHSRVALPVASLMSATLSAMM